MYVQVLQQTTSYQHSSSLSHQASFPCLWVELGLRGGWGRPCRGDVTFKSVIQGEPRALWNTAYPHTLCISSSSSPQKKLSLRPSAWAPKELSSSSISSPCETHQLLFSSYRLFLHYKSFPSSHSLFCSKTVPPSAPFVPTLHFSVYIGHKVDIVLVIFED